MTDAITINNTPIPIKEYNGFRVVTLKEIDTVHGRKDGTARKRFNDNRNRFIEGVDFFRISPSEFRTAMGEMDARQQNDITLMTESGYLMLVKSFTDDLAWQVQRELVNSYFRAKEQTVYTNTQRLGEVVELAKLTMRLMEKNKRRPADIVQAIGAQLEQFGVSMPDIFYNGIVSVTTADRALSPSITVADFLSEYGSVLDKPVGEVYSAYLDYCKRTGNTPIKTTRAFGSEIVRQTGINTKPRRLNGKPVRVYAE